LMFAAAPATGRADDLSGADRADIQALIGRQIDAFRHDDGTAAYSYAAPTIKRIFPTVDGFMAMVRNTYQPVYRPQSVTFGPLVATPLGIIQKVFLVGPDGKNYVALYTLQRQPDGSWLINGCSLVEDDGATI